MKVKVISNAFMKDLSQVNGLKGDLLIICGNFSPTNKNLVFALSKLCISFRNVIYIPSLLEFVCSSPPDNTFEEKLQFLKDFRSISGAANFHFLFNSSVEIDGYIFYGSPLFLESELELGNQNLGYFSSMKELGGIFESYKRVENGYQWVYISKEKALSLTEECYSFINSINFEENSILVTHECPIYRYAEDKICIPEHLFPSRTYPHIWIGGNIPPSRDKEFLFYSVKASDQLKKIFIYCESLPNLDSYPKDLPRIHSSRKLVVGKIGEEEPFIY